MRVPVKGSDQKEDIERITREMTLRYIKDPRTIILAVMPANQDLSTSDALQMARQVDPQGLRTIGVITKIDIMDRGTDAVRMLKGDDIPLRLGYVGVKLRSQQDIMDRKKVREAVEDESKWFQDHAKYGKLPPGLTGTITLVDKLTLVLCHHIRQFLPQIKREVSERVRKCEDRLEELGTGVPEGAADRVQMMWTMISAYADMFTNTIRGKYDKRLTLFMQETKETQSGGAKVRAVFNDFLSTYSNERGVGSLMTDDEIDTAIKMHEGDSLPGFPSPDTFEFLVLPHLKKIQEPAIECLTEVSQIVENFVQYETGSLFTNDVGYLNNHGTMSNMYKDSAAPPPPGTDVNSFVNNTGGPGNAPFVREIRERLNSYFKLVIRNARDAVPKAVGYFLVRKLQEILQFELYNQLASADKMSELLGEPPHIVEERRSLAQELKTLRGASSVLQKDIASNLSVEDALGNLPPGARTAPARAPQPGPGPAAAPAVNNPSPFQPASRPQPMPQVPPAAPQPAVAPGVPP